MSAVAHDGIGRSEPRRMPCLDGLRGLAALMVVFSHTSDRGLGHFVSPMAGASGVLIFFGLSGFLMGDLYLARTPTPDAIKRYIAARIARIAPIYYAVVIASFVVSTLVMPAFVYHFSPAQFIRLLTFNGSASVFWSISPEVQFYFAFIPLWILRARLDNDLGFAAILAALAALCIATIGLWPGIVVFSKFHIFACGVLAAMVRSVIAPHMTMGRTLLLHAVSVALLVALVVPGGSDALFRDPHAGHVNDPTMAAFYGDPGRCLLAGLLALSFSFKSRLGLALFANPLAILIGRCSFSIYLLHVAIFFVVAQSGLVAALGQITGDMLALVLTLVAATATYTLFEAPARVRVGRLLLAAMSVGRGSLPLRRRAA